MFLKSGKYLANHNLAKVARSAYYTYCIDKKLFATTLTLGVIWRGLLVISYIFALNAVNITFNKQHLFDQLSWITWSPNLITQSALLALISFVLFALCALFDFTFTKNKQHMEMRINAFLTRKIPLHAPDALTEITSKNKHFAAQVISKSIDVCYASILFATFLGLFAWLSWQLTLSLLVVMGLSAIASTYTKRKSSKNIKENTSKGNQRKVRNEKLFRAATTRSLSLITAGAFLAILITLIGLNALSGISIVELVIIAFCIRFLVSFFSIIIINLNSLLDSVGILTEFEKITLKD